MSSIPAILSLVICGRCNSPLVNKEINNGFTHYFCQCSQKIRVLLTCTHCKKQFLNLPYLIRKTNYCSLKCYWTSTNRRQLRICKSCKKEFHADAVLIKKGYGFYCSRDCWFNIFKRWKREVKCRQCKKTFLVIRAVYKKNPKFCSKKCKDDSERDFVTRICRNCKKKFDLPRYRLNRGQGSFCTWECFKKYQGESSLEMTVRQQLEKMNETFQQEMKVGKSRLHADFYLPKRNLIIECDGEHWHMSQKAKMRDKRKDKILEKLGYNILRLRGQDIMSGNFVSIIYLSLYLQYLVYDLGKMKLPLNEI